MRTRLSTLPSLAELLQSMPCVQDPGRPTWPANPFPRGIRSGSATEKILIALVSAYPRWMEHGELMNVTGRSRGAVAWGVRYLAEHRLVRSIPSSRNPQYLRYQAMPKQGEPT